MSSPIIHPLPASVEECRQRGWDNIDILLVSGDAYVDHPSFGIALIGRYLEHHGYRVAILAQPHYDSPRDFLAFGRPRLFCGITAGNLDSIVANYSGNGKVRETDAYSPGGSHWRSEVHDKANRYRPDRASLVYANLARRAFKDLPIVLGGIESSLRRFVHYDYKQNKLRTSFLTDAKADLLVYGMAEQAVLTIARKCAAQRPLTGITGSCERLTASQLEARYPQCLKADNEQFIKLPSWQEIAADNDLFLEAEIAIDKHARSGSTSILLQQQQSHWLIQHPPSPPLEPRQLDSLYTLPYSRKPHPSTPDIPAHRMIQHSVTIVRGCSGNCSFCAISRHQGATVQSRSVSSIVEECRTIAAMDDFQGTISDLGGPTANLFGTSCAKGSCKRRDCLYPSRCKHLRIDEDVFIRLLQTVAGIENIRHVFISSGMRMELLLQAPKLLNTLLEKHLPGAIKIAPEHSVDRVLELMHKEPHLLLQKFVTHCREIGKRINRKISFVPYVISAHPGCTQQHAAQLAADMKKLGLTVAKPQDFTATPGTLSTAMYVTGRDSIRKKRIFVARNGRDRRKQRLQLLPLLQKTKQAPKPHRQDRKTIQRRGKH